MNFFHKRKLTFYIRENKLKYLYAQTSKNTLTVLKKGTILFDPALVENHMLLNCEETVKTIQNLMLKEEILEKKIDLNISDPSIILRIAKVPFIPQKELKAYFDMEISHLFPVDAQDALYDYKVLEKIEDAEKPMLNTLLISIPKKLRENYVEIFGRAGLSIDVLDVYPNTLGTAYRFSPNSDIAIVDVTDQSMDFIIISNGNLFMYSSVFLDASFHAISDSQMDVNMLIETFGEIEQLFLQLIGYIRSYMGFFSSRKFGKNMDHLYLLGDITKFEGICEYFHSTFNLPVTLGLHDSFRITEEKNHALYPYAGNIGLCLRGG